MRLEFDNLTGAAGPARQYPGSQLTQQPEFGDNPGALRMFRYIPAGLAAGAPLVVILHGCMQTARGYDHGTGWSSLAERYGFALLAPEQSRVNNPNGCFNWFQPEDTARGSGEAASIRQMIARLLDEHGLDAKRVFVTGLSAGGAMTSAMLAAYPELFAGGAIIAGLPHGAASNLSEALAAMHRPLPRGPGSWGHAVRNASPHQGPWPRISVWHGDADDVVAFSNMEAIVSQWQEVHGLTQPPRDEREAGHLRRVWHDAQQMPVIEAYSVSGLGHGTPIKPGGAPDACGEAGPFILDAGISSSVRIAEFFGLTHKVRAAAKPVLRKAVAAARAILTIPEPAETAEPRIEETFASAAGPQEMPRIDPPETRAMRLQRIITKALRAAGLMKDN